MSERDIRTWPKFTFRLISGAGTERRIHCGSELSVTALLTMAVVDTPKDTLDHGLVSYSWELQVTRK